ncbi:hypothetical protein PT974_01692 [Cladobotryum mycophilum]|uniref:Uncharacterized protein n=1 Tax=Cladobotryum mycophilum TaxID=491253 RepID=A0ABR0SW22_9HYPO
MAHFLIGWGGCNISVPLDAKLKSFHAYFSSPIATGNFVESADLFLGD